MPDDDVLADRYEPADATLREAGFDWYEVSNWATSDGRPLPAQRAVLGQRQLVGRSARARTATSAGCAGGTSSTRPPTPTGWPAARARPRTPNCSTTPTGRSRRSCSACGCARACRSTALSATGRVRARDAVARGLLEPGAARRRPRRPHRPRPAARRRRHPRPDRLRTPSSAPLARSRRTSAGRRHRAGCGGMGRFDVLRRIEELDPARDFAEIYRLWAPYEFPWDMNQALSFALFRTYAVPSIGALLARTGELTERHAEALRRHRPDPGRGARARVGQRRGPGGDPADEPDAPVLRHQQRRPALRPGHLRRHPDPLARRLRLAPDDRDRADRERQLLPRPRPAHGHPGRARRPGRPSSRRSTPTSASTSGSTPGGRRGRRVHARPAGHVPAERPAARPPWSGGSRSRRWTARCWTPSPSRIPPGCSRGLVRGGLKARGRVVRFLPAAVRAPLRPAAAADSAATRTATRWPALGTFPPAARCRIPGRITPASAAPHGLRLAPKGRWRVLPIRGYRPRSGNAAGPERGWSAVDVSTSRDAPGHRPASG